MSTLKLVGVWLTLLALCLIDRESLLAQEKAEGRSSAYRWEKDLPYRSVADPTGHPDRAYMAERCKLDLYLPADKKGFSTVVWFHGGGLTKGNKEVPAALREKGIAVVAPNYRLSPRAQAPAYIEDAAEAVAWTFQNIERLGGDRKKIFVSGHSAGGYLTSMIGLDKKWLEKHGIDANEIAGLVPFSGQAITHFTIRKERGISDKQPIVDPMAPLFHIRKDAPSILFLSGDREKELLGRYEETAYMWRMLKEVGHPKVELYELQGYDHGGMAEPGFPLLLQFIKKTSG